MSSNTRLMLLFITLIIAGCSKKEMAVTRPDTSGIQTFEFNGTSRQYLLYLPAGLPANAPLVFVLHGFGQNAQTFYDIGFNPIADTAKFALCFPQGQNFAWDITTHNPVDVRFLKALAKELQGRYSLNPNKTFATGYSMGGAMCNLLAMDAGDVFKAVAPVAGFVYQKVWASKSPQVSNPYFAIHGTADRTVNINGFSIGDPSIKTITDYWGTQNNCTSYDSLAFNSTTTAYLRSNGANGKQVWFYKVEGLDHVFPGDPKARDGQDVSGFKAANEIWRFFKKW